MENGTWLKAVKIDEKGNKSPMGRFVDPDSVDNPEVVASDSAEISAFVFDRERGILQISLVFGGYTTDGKFVENPEYKRKDVLVSWSRAQFPELWQALDLPNFFRQPFTRPLIEQLVEWMHQADTIRAATQNVLQVPDYIASEICDVDGNVLVPAKGKDTPPEEKLS